MKTLKAKCTKCNQILESTRGGHFVACDCGASYIDRDRWFPDERYRMGGEVEFVSFN